MLNLGIMPKDILHVKILYQEEKKAKSLKYHLKIFPNTYSYLVLNFTGHIQIDVDHLDPSFWE